ncbi:MAG TPA: helix-turn-helix domain-containing protein [Candidatus Paceibacterota bacterium]|jgi:DNA-binding transcriptional regulator YdaS (Cro superfamily)|nr:helix-turn-helix domain-containing protein [Candidatus Paceibacterota bacterium]
MDHLLRAYKIFGTQAALAKAIGVVPQVVNNWQRRGNIPAEYCPAIERATAGQVKCEDLRPDVDWSVLRCTCAKDGPDTSLEQREAA